MASSRSIGSLTIDLLLKYAGFEQGLDKAARTAKTKSKEIETGFTGAFKTIGAAVSGFVAGLATVQSAITGFNNAVNAADRLDELSARYDISTEKLSALGYAAKMTGGDLESLAGVIPKFSKNVAEAADASSKMGGVFAALGVSVKDADGGLRNFEDLLPEIADKFRSLDDSTTETALAMELFGRSGAEFLEFLNLGSEGLQTMEDRARELGIVIDTETASKAAQFKDRVDDLKAATQGWFTQIAAELLPTLTDLTTELTDFVKEGGDAVTIADSIASSLRDIADAIRFLGSLSDVFDRIRGGLAGLEKQGNAVFRALSGQAAFDGGWESVKAQYAEGTALIENGWKAMQAADEKGRRAFEDDGKRKVRGGQLQGAASRDQFIDKALADRLSDFFSGQDKPDKSGGGKSKAQQEAEALTRAYDSLSASLDQQISLMGEVTKEAEVRYEVEYGALVNLEPKLKNYLVYKAQEYDEKKALLDQQKEEQKLYEEEQKRIERSLQDGRQLLSDLQFEVQLMGLSNREREKAIALRQLETEGLDAYGDQVAAQIDIIYDQMERIEIMDGFREGFSNFFQDVISGTASVSDAFKNMLDDINRMILQRIADNWVEQLFGAMGTSQSGSSGNWMGWIAGLFGGGKASGGWAAANSIYEVNERGLEMATVNGRDYMLTGSSPVMVTPNHKLGGGMTQNINFSVVGRVDRRTQDQIAQEVGRKASVATRRNG